jgi:hypothetical protein
MIFVIIADLLCQESEFGCSAGASSSESPLSSPPPSPSLPFSRPNGDVKLVSRFNSTADRETTMRADEWIIHRAKLQPMANFKGAERLHQSCGTEHDRERDRAKASLDKPATAVEVMLSSQTRHTLYNPECLAVDRTPLSRR